MTRPQDYPGTNTEADEHALWAADARESQREFDAAIRQELREERAR